jgi:hypothetical protein
MVDELPRAKGKPGRKKSADPAVVKVMISLTRAEYEDAKDRAGLVPLAKLFRTLALKAMAITPREEARAAKAG